MKHYEVNFVDGTYETVMSDELPPIVRPSFFINHKTAELYEVHPFPSTNFWTVTLLNLDAETNSKLVPFGQIHINLDNVTFIKET